MRIDTVQRRENRLWFVGAFAPVSVILLTVLCTGANLLAQEESGAIPDIENHHASAIREPCIPTEEERDPDVFKRPCFVRTLRFSRRFAPVHGLTRTQGGVQLPAEAIPATSLHRFRGLLAQVLKPEYLPASWATVDFNARASCRARPISEIRNGVPTFVRQEYDCTGVTSLTEGNPIQAAWALNGIDVLPQIKHGTRFQNRAAIRLRLYGDDRLTIRPRPPGDDGDRPGAMRNFFDREAFHDLLTSVFQVPFETTEDWLVDGRDGEPAGVRVFHGTIRSRDWEMHRREPEAPSNPLRWWDEIRLLVTESDPQYFCVEIVLRAADAAPEGKP